MKIDTNRFVCVYIEEWITGTGDTESAWVRHRRLGMGLHPAYADSQIKLLRKFHPGSKYRTVEVKDDDDDIPF